MRGVEMSNQQDQRAGLRDAPPFRGTLFCEVGPEGYCAACSDDALPARVLSVEDDTGLALVEAAGTTAEIDVTLVDDVAPGDWLLTHGGVAIGRLEEGHDHQNQTIQDSPGRKKTDEICG
jgi:hydrogenase assembly chaperone HypC/HupF